jgi:glycerate 2-kinase
MQNSPVPFLYQLFDVALQAALPGGQIGSFLPDKPAGRCVVIGAGKASAAMAQAFEAAWPYPVDDSLVITRYGYERPCSRIVLASAAHPVPDENGVAATKVIMDKVSKLGSDDLVVALMSGGGSALLCAPVDGLTLNDKQEVNKALLRSGLPIAAMNCVRSSLSAVKGGRLARLAAPARVCSLLISDVAGDDPALIASGPTIPIADCSYRALQIVQEADLDMPHSLYEKVTGLLERNAQSDALQPVSLPENSFHIIARPRQSLEAAAHYATQHGVKPIIVSDRLEGDAVATAQNIAQQVKALQEDMSLQRPCVLLSGGELTVTVKGHGRGGPNTTFLLALARELQSARGVYALSADTDGIDGCDDMAGAVITPDTLQRARQAGLSVDQSLLHNDSHGFFKKIGDNLVTGPTYTNVNDFRAILIQ